ncbi:MAG: undecaprenyl-diphosphatase UppP [Candidatus Buchananbacteria bacterium]
MLDVFYSIFAGVIQGLAEFLPISSSGHLLLFHYFTGFDFVDNLSFDVVLHLGTLAALLIFFWSDLWRYFFAFLNSFRKWDLKNDSNQRLAWYILIATIPALFFGYFFDDLIESLFRNPASVAWVIMIFGLVLYFADKYFAKLKTVEQLNLGQAFLIGLAQAFALIPGVSRSGITIVAGLSQKLKRDQAARFSFLLSVPAVLAAGGKKTLDLYQMQAFNFSDLLILASGFLVSALVGYLCIKYFLKFLKNHSLKVFVYYRLILGILVLFLLAFGFKG